MFYFDRRESTHFMVPLYLSMAIKVSMEAAASAAATTKETGYFCII